LRGTIRYVAFLALAIWLGSLVFFALVEAPVAFATLSSTHLAGQVVALSLTRLHGIAIVCGLLLIGCLLLLGAEGRHKALIAGLMLTTAMLILTLASQFVVIPRMEAYRIHAGGDITLAPRDNPDYVAFNRLHHISEHLEEAVLIGALVLLGVMVHRPSRTNS
jgi:hypothetical protein